MGGLLFLTITLLASIPEFFCIVTVEQELSVLEGKSLTIPCHYEPQYASYVKYWCQGDSLDLCDSKARTDDPLSANAEVSIFDDPVQQVFTVTMHNLKEEDSDSYICGVEIGGFWSRDDAGFTNIKVVHGLSVIHSKVSGQEGTSVTVECLYSERYRQSQKMWCRSGDWRSCVQTGSDGKYEGVSVAIMDDRTEAFTVTLKKLQMKDSGWYLCAVGQHKMLIQILVTPQPTTDLPALAVTSIKPLEQKAQRRSTPSCQHHESGFHPVLLSMVGILSFIVLLGLALLMRMQWKQRMHDSVLRKVSGPLNKCSGDDEDMQNAAVIIFSKDSQDTLMY